MRLHTFRARKHAENNLPTGPEGANAGPGVTRENHSVPLNTHSQNPRIFVESFDGNRFIEDTISCCVNQAVDVIDLWNRTWCVRSETLVLLNRFGLSMMSTNALFPSLFCRFGSYDANDLNRTSSAESNAQFQRHPTRRPPPPRPRLPADAIPYQNGTPQVADTTKWALPWNASNSSASGAIPVSPSVSAEQQARILQELPGIGTWAGRQRLFSVRPQFEIPTSRTERPPVLEDAIATPTARSPTQDGISEKSQESDSEDNEAVQPLHGDYNGGLNGYIPRNGVGNGGSIVAPLRRSSSNTSSETRHRHEAWRWRFSRKWEAEQKRAMEEDPATAEVEDDLDALGYLQACGMGMDLQVLEAHRRGRGRGRGVSRATSGHIKAPTPKQRGETGAVLGIFRDSSSVSTITMQFDVEPSYASATDLLAQEDSGTFGQYLSTPDPANASNPAEATRDLLNVAIRGRELLERQRELESEATARWDEIERTCKGDREWAGLFLPKVEVPMSGNFLYVVLRVAEHQGAQGSRQRFLLRAREKRSNPMELLEETIAQAAAVCAEHSLPGASVSLVGAGMMEWRSDTDRHVLLSPAPKNLNLGGNGNHAHGSSHNHTFGGSSSPPGDFPGDMCGLAASLLRQSLPCHFQVITKNHSFAPHNGTLA